MESLYSLILILMQVLNADLSELFLNDGQNFDLKFRRVLDQLKEDDHINIDMRSDILNGYRYDDKHI